MIRDVKLELTLDGWRILIFIEGREKPVAMFIDKEDSVEDMTLNAIHLSGKFLDIQQDMAAGL